MLPSPPAASLCGRAVAQRSAVKSRSPRLRSPPISLGEETNRPLRAKSARLMPPSSPARACRARCPYLQRAHVAIKEVISAAAKRVCLSSLGADYVGRRAAPGPRMPNLSIIGPVVSRLLSISEWRAGSGSAAGVRDGRNRIAAQ